MHIINVLVFVSNTLACVTLPLDLLNKVLKSKDSAFINIPMNAFSALNMLVWTLIGVKNESLPMTAANGIGVAC